MSNENVISNETLIIDVEKKDSSALGWIGRITAILLGAFGLLIGSLLCLTIIGILLGFPLMVLSLPVLMTGIGKQRVDCPHCKKKNYVLSTAENLTCPKCRNLTVINWK